MRRLRLTLPILKVHRRDRLFRAPRGNSGARAAGQAVATTLPRAALRCQHKGCSGECDRVRLEFTTVDNARFQIRNYSFLIESKFELLNFRQSHPFTVSSLV